MLAEPLARTEQEIVNGVGHQFGRSQRVVERLLAKIPQRLLHHCRIRLALQAPLLGETTGTAAALVRNRQHQRFLFCSQWQPPGCRRHTDHLIALSLAHRVVRHQPHVPGQADASLADKGYRHGKQPTPLGGLDNDLIRIAGAITPPGRQGIDPVRCRPTTAVQVASLIHAAGNRLLPGPAIKMAQCQAAPVALCRRRHIAVKSDTERQRGRF